MSTWSLDKFKESEGEMHTTQLQIFKLVEVDGEKCFRCVIPAWNPNKFITLKISRLPAGLQPLIKPGMFLNCQANIEAMGLGDLKIQDFEIPPAP